MLKYPRITINQQKMGGVPCIRNLRIPVATVLGMFAEGMKEQEILAAFPNLESGDIQEALDYMKDSGELNC